MAGLIWPSTTPASRATCGRLAEQTEANYDAVMDINVKGVWLSMKYEIPRMLEHGGGAIVNCFVGCRLDRVPGDRDLRRIETRCYRPNENRRSGIFGARNSYQRGQPRADRHRDGRPACRRREYKKDELAPLHPSGVSAGSRRWPRPFCGSVPAGRLLSPAIVCLSTADSPRADTHGLDGLRSPDLNVDLGFERPMDGTLRGDLHQLRALLWRQ